MDELKLTHREVRRMRMIEVQRQFRYWARFPTIRDMVAFHLGVEPRSVSGAHAGPTTEEAFRAAFLTHGTVANA